VNTEEVLSVDEARRGWVTAVLSGGPVLLPSRAADAMDLKPGSSVDGDAVRREAAVLQISDARMYANRYLAMAERSTGQLAGKLRERGYMPEVVRGCMDWAREYGLVDDLRYARAFAAGRTMGRAALRARLRKNGVSEAAVAQATSDMDDAGQTEALTEMIRRKYGCLEDRERALRRAAGWLARRGYPPSIIARVLERAL
jgi:regulatory protein